MARKLIGVLTAGGDCPGLNAAIRAVGKAAYGNGMEVIGFLDGFRGLVENRTMRLEPSRLSGILASGGTLLGTSRDKPHLMPVGGKGVMDMTPVAVDNYQRLHLDALVCLGGNGTQKNAYRLMKEGLYHSATEEAFFALQQTPTYLPLHSVMGEMLAQSGDIEGGVAKFQVVSRSYAARGEMQQAIQFARKVVELAPTDLSARTKLIEQLLAFGQVENAIDEYVQLAEVYYSLADLNMARKTYTEALRTAQQANVDRSLRVRILHRMADIDVQSLDWRQALRVLEQIRTLQPDDFEARSQIIQLNIRLGQEPQALAEVDNGIQHRHFSPISALHTATGSAGTAMPASANRSHTDRSGRPMTPG